MMLDKSVFHGLSHDEHSDLNILFKPVLPHVLAHEVISDLIKTPRRSDSGRTPPESVQVLARKFLGSGPAVCVDARTAAIGSLTGNRIPMTGRIPMTHGVRHDLPDGGYGVMFDLHPLNRAIMRWSAGHFEALEKEFAEKWKATMVETRPERFRRRLYDEHVISRTVGTPAELRLAIDQVFDVPSYQRIWLEWLLDEMRPSPSVRSAIMLRWRASGQPYLVDYALYAAHCVRCMLALDIATRSGLVAWHKHHRIDLQYLFYLPFCMVFTSNDALHAALAPSLMRANQSFVPGDALKAELRAISSSGSPVRFGPVSEEVVAAAPIIAALHRDHLRGSKAIYGEGKDSLV